MKQIDALNNFILEEYKKFCDEYKVNMFKSGFDLPFETKDNATVLFDIKSVERLVTINFKNLGMIFFKSTMSSGYGFYHIKEKCVYHQKLRDWEDLKEYGLTEYDKVKPFRIISKKDKLSHFNK